MPDYQHLQVAVDAIVLGYRDGGLHTLLIRRKYGSLKGTWALPGGFVKKDEALSVAVTRELQEEAGITVKYLEQLYTFGDDVHRDPRGRVISVAYFALVDGSAFQPVADSDASDARWFPMGALPKLAFDHRKMVDTALERLRGKLSYQPVGFDLLDREFPFSDLETLYATILGRAIDRRNFRKKALALGILVPTGKRVSAGSGRPAELFRFDRRKYEALRRKGQYLDLDLG